jgi:sec-independent protein translocase protein TatA
MPRIGPLGIWEILIILVVILLIFGPRRLPEMAKGIGQSVREFRKGIRDMKEDFESETKDKPSKASESRTATAESGAAATAAATTADANDDPKRADKPSSNTASAVTATEANKDKTIDADSVVVKAADDDSHKTQSTDGKPVDQTV